MKWWNSMTIILAKKIKCTKSILGLAVKWFSFYLSVYRYLCINLTVWMTCFAFPGITHILWNPNLWLKISHFHIKYMMNFSSKKFITVTMLKNVYFSPEVFLQRSDLLITRKCIPTRQASTSQSKYMPHPSKMFYWNLSNSVKLSKLQRVKVQNIILYSPYYWYNAYGSWLCNFDLYWHCIPIGYHKGVLLSQNLTSLVYSNYFCVYEQTSIN